MLSDSEAADVVTDSGRLVETPPPAEHGQPIGTSGAQNLRSLTRRTA